MTDFQLRGHQRHLQTKLVCNYGNGVVYPRISPYLESNHSLFGCPVGSIVSTVFVSVLSESQSVLQVRFRVRAQVPVFGVRVPVLIFGVRVSDRQIGCRLSATECDWVRVRIRGRDLVFKAESEYMSAHSRCWISSLQNKLISHFFIHKLGES